MQTFLPYPDFAKSAACLDPKRLGKQRVEAFQIHNTLTGKSNGWVNHPATKMWRGYEVALAAYFNVMRAEWIRRNYNNTMAEMHIPAIPYVVEMPPWFGDKDFHSSHRSNLLRKDPIWYSQFNWYEPPNIPYVWPVK